MSLLRAITLQGDKHVAGTLIKNIWPNLQSRTMTVVRVALSPSYLFKYVSVPRTLPNSNSIPEANDHGNRWCESYLVVKYSTTWNRYAGIDLPILGMNATLRFRRPCTRASSSSSSSSSSRSPVVDCVRPLRPTVLVVISNSRLRPQAGCCA